MRKLKGIKYFIDGQIIDAEIAEEVLGCTNIDKLLELANSRDWAINRLAHGRLRILNPIIENNLSPFGGSNEKYMGRTTEDQIEDDRIKFDFDD